MASSKEFWVSKRTNDYTFLQYYYRLTELAISMFKWTGLPDTIDSRFMELVLFSQGKCLFFYDEDLGYLSLRCTIGGGFNVYRIPLLRNVIADNGYHAQRTIDNSVIIWNNLIRTNSMLDVNLYSERLAEIDRTIDVNIKAQKTPILIHGKEAEMLTLKNIYQKYDGNQPVIFSDKSFEPESVTVLTTGAPFVADNLNDLRRILWNEALTYLGINNINITKRARLLTDEVMRTSAGVVASRMSRVKARQNACEEINRMFGLDIWCEYENDIEDYAEIKDIMKDGVDEQDKEVEINE